MEPKPDHSDLKKFVLHFIRETKLVFEQAVKLVDGARPDSIGLKANAEFLEPVGKGRTIGDEALRDFQQLIEPVKRDAHDLCAVRARSGRRGKHSLPFLARALPALTFRWRLVAVLAAITWSNSA